MLELDGRPASDAELTALAVTNHGHFTFFRVEHGAVRGVALHRERLARDCRALFGVDLPVDAVDAAVRRGIDACRGAEAVRVTIFDPELDTGRPAEPATPHVLVTVHSLADPAGGRGLRAATAPFTRDRPEIKHVGLFSMLCRRREAQLAGADDVLYLSGDGFVGEGATWNVGFYDGRDVVWPEADVLPGITAALLGGSGPGAVVRPVHRDALGRMEAAFATNCTFGVRPVVGIDEFTFPAEHPVLERLRADYRSVPLESWPGGS